MDSIPLDDLLPTNDSCYTPPAHFVDLYAPGGAAWELVDVYKWIHLSNSMGNKFIAGYMACHFDVMLKSGRPFRVTLMDSFGSDLVDLFIRRAKMFNRTATISRSSVEEFGVSYVTVSGHGE
jgi:hypothetical protein